MKRTVTAKQSLPQLEKLTSKIDRYKINIKSNQTEREIHMHCFHSLHMGLNSLSHCSTDVQASCVFTYPYLNIICNKCWWDTVILALHMFSKLCNWVEDKQWTGCCRVAVVLSRTSDPLSFRCLCVTVLPPKYAHYRDAYKTPHYLVKT